MGGLFNSIKGRLASKKPETAKQQCDRIIASRMPKDPRASPAASSATSPSTRPEQTGGRSPYGISARPTRRPNNSGTSARGAPDEPPPAYTPAAPAPAPAPASSAAATATTDDPYTFLSTFNTVFLIDDSGSMAGRSWRETAEALRVIAPICTAHDSDGIDLHFLNHADNVEYRNVSSAADVERIFASVRPAGGTPTGTRLHHILKPYLVGYAAKPDTTKPLNIIVITDGVPADDVESVIISAARKLDRLDAPAWQTGIQFFQVGNEPGAREALKDLDDNLGEFVAGGAGAELRDMVDTIPFEAMSGGALDGRAILKAVLGAVTRRYDRMRTSVDSSRA